MIHHGPNTFRPDCLLMFFLGQIIHAWAQARDIIRDKSNGVSTYRQYWDLRGPEIVKGFFGSYLIYGAWQTGLLATLIGDWIPGAESFMAVHPHPIPFNHLTAGAFGYLGDYILKGLIRAVAKNPALRALLKIGGQLPPPSDDSAAKKETP